MSRPRIRTIKPEAWHDEKLGQVSRDGRLLFVVLITFADDQGRFRALPSAICGHGYPYDDDAPRKVVRWLTELTEAGLVATYHVGGVPYGVIPKWGAHQKINRSRASILPEPSLNGHGKRTAAAVNAQ